MISIISRKVKAVLSYARTIKQEDSKEKMEKDTDLFDQLMKMVGVRFRIFTQFGLSLMLLKLAASIVFLAMPVPLVAFEDENEEDESIPMNAVGFCADVADFTLFFLLLTSLIKKKFLASMITVKLISIKLGLVWRITLHCAALAITWVRFTGESIEELMSDSEDIQDEDFSIEDVAYLWIAIILFLVASLFELINLYGTLFKKSKAINWFTKFRSAFVYVLLLQLSFLPFSFGEFIAIFLITVAIYRVELSINNLMHDIVKFEEDVSKIKNENVKLENSVINERV